jgi:hypothetical protein
MAADDVLVNAEQPAKAADFVLVQPFKRFNNTPRLPLCVHKGASHIVVALDKAGLLPHPLAAFD